MTTGTFTLMAFDEGGEKVGPSGQLRLVCRIEGGGKLAIWGSAGQRQNIDAVLRTGLPCTVECEFSDPSAWGQDFGHTHWVPQNTCLTVLLEQP